MQSWLDSFVPDMIYAYLLILTRVGGTLMVLPGFGETFVSPRIRIAFAALLGFVLLPVLKPVLPSVPANAYAMVVAVVHEAIIGIFLGIFARILLASLEIGGMIIASQMGISAATLFNPVLATQGSLISVFLTLAGIEIMFITDVHHLFFYAMRDSYVTFPATMSVPLSDISDSIARVVNDSFRLAVQISAPFLVLATIFFVGMGLLSRLMPQMQIFFIAMPIQILLGLLLFSASFSAMLLLYIEYMNSAVSTHFLVGG